MTDVMEYPKIETAFNRDDKFKVIADSSNLRDPAFGVPQDWLVTEKVDGTNVRIHFEPAVDANEIVPYINEDGASSAREALVSRPATVTFHGRTSKAQMPTFLLQYLQETFTPERFIAAGFDSPLTLYGEGYGARIQKGGGNYRPDSVSFRLFDVLVYGREGRPWWLNWSNIVDIAAKLDIQHVPFLGFMRLDDIVKSVRKGVASDTALADCGKFFIGEGIVARTEPLLFMRNWQRLVFKLKTTDF